MVNRLPPQGENDFTDVDGSLQPEHLLEYLDRVARMPQVSDLRQVAVGAMDLQMGQRVLEVGCGTGECTREFAQRVGENGLVVGSDHSEQLILEARRRTRRDLSIEYEVDDACNLGFPDDTFDACFVERTLIHLTDSSKAVSEIVRVARPGARIVAVENDVMSITIDAVQSNVTAVFKTFLANTFQSPIIGSQLYGIFKQFGLHKVNVKARCIAFTTWSSFKDIVAFEDHIEDAIEEGTVPLEEWAEWIAGLEAADRAGLFFASGTMFIVSGIL